jgi:rSAM/selenodomain-associated transferase 2
MGKKTESIMKFSIIIPVFHEAENINPLLNHLTTRESTDNYEIIVVDGSSTKDTINTIIDKKVVKISSSNGRACQMNEGAAKAKGEILVFLHADTLLLKNAFSIIDRELSQNNFVAGAFSLEIDSKKILFRLLAKFINLRSKLTRVPYGDQAFFIKSDFFKKIGGFKDIEIMEDVEFMRRIKKLNIPIVIVPEKVFTSTRRWGKEGILRCTFRNWMIRLLYYLGIHPKKIVKFYKSN